MFSGVKVASGWPWDGTARDNVNKNSLLEAGKHGRMNYKDTKTYRSAFLTVDLLTDFAALCLTDFIDWRYTHPWFVFSTQLVNCCTHGWRSYLVFTVLLKLYRNLIEYYLIPKYVSQTCVYKIHLTPILSKKLQNKDNTDNTALKAWTCITI